LLGLIVWVIPLLAGFHISNFIYP